MLAFLNLGLTDDQPLSWGVPHFLTPSKNHVCLFIYLFVCLFVKPRHRYDRTTHNARTGTWVPIRLWHWVQVPVRSACTECWVHVSAQDLLCTECWVHSECSVLSAQCNLSALNMCVFMFNVTNNTVLVLLVPSLLNPSTRRRTTSWEPRSRRLDRPTPGQDTAWPTRCISPSLWTSSSNPPARPRRRCLDAAPSPLPLRPPSCHAFKTVHQFFLQPIARANVKNNKYKDVYGIVTRLLHLSS